MMRLALGRVEILDAGEMFSRGFGALLRWECRQRLQQAMHGAPARKRVRIADARCRAPAGAGQ